MWDWFRTLISGRPHFLIGSPDNPYLRRWYLLPRNPLGNVYLHQFLRDDDDRALHDHPWWSVSIILRGGYVETTPATDGTHRQRWHGPGSVIFRRATQRHRVELRRNAAGLVPAWTLFLTGPRVREWGFWCPKGFVPWHRFVKRGAHGEVGPGCDG